MQVIVGSTALKYFGVNRSEPKDLDVWGDIVLDDHKADYKYIPSTLLSLVPIKDDYATPDAIYTIKCSHLGWDNPMWCKHKADILWLKAKGCNLIPELYNVLTAFWKKELGNKEFLSLDKSKEGFFNDHVNYKFDHDFLHEMVAFPNQPVYNECLRDGNEVLIDKDKFFAMPFNKQVRMFREEISVIACERWLLNNYWKGEVSWFKSYKLSLKKTITNLTKNWACDFIVQNLEEFIKPDFSYFKYVIEQLGDKDMSNVDLSVFDEVADLESSLSQVILGMCEGNYDYPSSPFKEFGYEHLAQEGGGEGGSEDCYGVFKFKGKVYRAEYNYYSYNGYEYDNIVETLREVKPVEKTVVVYE